MTTVVKTVHDSVFLTICLLIFWVVQLINSFWIDARADNIRANMLTTEVLKLMINFDCLKN